MLSNAYFLAKYSFDTAENEPAKNLQNLNFANSNLQKAGPTSKDLEGRHGHRVVQQVVHRVGRVGARAPAPADHVGPQHALHGG